MSSSNLLGPILKLLWNLTNIEVLDLQNNHLEGPISPFLRFAKLREFSLRKNNFYGQLDLDLSDNHFSGKIQEFKSQKLFSISVKQNQLEGPIPKSFLNQQGLYYFILSQNNLSGYIDSAICDLNLGVLNLGSCNLDGTIPQCLGEMSELWVLDLSNNSLRGFSHNHLVGCIPKGKQFDTFETSSYQGNEGLRGFPLSKDCGGDDGVPQATNPVELDQEKGGDSPMINWQVVLMGYCCGLVIVLSVIYIMLSTQNLVWFSRMVDQLEHRIITRMKKHKKGYVTSRIQA
ncbi:hypothetical protein KY290_000284 [Solanum tuberosum]|uniref:Uncharacterized protein n=1 Tax=Solanum tuberosum TaxID=4113 RepID=A0ABQ7WIZ0_SOLTU|nr:hypothetical protein KY290_000284 [Solanum tuberosum]